MDLIGKVKEVDTGTVIELQTSDSGSKDDVPEWLEESGHELLDIVDHGDYWSVYVEKT
jgi:tRNA 2-thiouridine synthesizing protein A